MPPLSNWVEVDVCAPRGKSHISHSLGLKAYSNLHCPHIQRVSGGVTMHGPSHAPQERLDASVSNVQALQVHGPAGTEQEEGAQPRVGGGAAAETGVLQTLQTEAEASFSNVQAAQLIFAGHSGHSMSFTD